jgi:hypothetical protein
MKLTRAIRVLTVPSTNLKKTSQPSFVIEANVSSSATNGETRTMEKGQPMTPPIPNHMIPTAVFMPPRQSMKAAMPSMAVYIEKLEGRYAAAAWNMPGLESITIINMIPILGFMIRDIVENSHASLKAQARPSKTRRK